MGQVTHLCNFGTPLYQGSRRILNVVAIPNAIIPKEIVGGEDGVSTKETNPPTTSH